MRKIALLALIMIMALTFGGCAKIPLNKSDDEVTQITGKERTFVESEFVNPALRFRPLPIIHSDEYSKWGVNESNLNLIKDYGYGGVVTNVSFNNYLENEELWESYVRNIKYAIDVLGLRVWIYDELHYPSGAAGGLVLRDNPEWQAEGLVNDINYASKGQTVTVEVPYGHNLVFAKAFKGTTVDDMDLSSETDLMSRLSNGKITYTAQDSSVIITQYSKYFYEGTHAVNNWAALRRYINILKKEPVQKFITVTYEEYKKRLGNYFSKVEAFFTDEPSMLGTYFDGPPTTPAVVDPVDPNIPLYPTVNYASDIAPKFKAARGYEMGSNTVYLFSGTSDDAKRFRWDYYKTLGELMSSNYSGQIAKWCGDNGVKMSGHFLLEENIYMHPVFNGNLIQNMMPMQIPGIDLLTAYPETAASWAVTAAKFASSAAHFKGTTQVMSEVSDAFDSYKNPSIYGRICSVAVQYAFGVNNINSYYYIQNMSEEENKLFALTIGRMGYMLDGGAHECRVAVYYPIEGVYTDTLPPEHLNRFNSNVITTSNNFTSVSKKLSEKQIDFDYLDSINLSKCEVKDGALVTPSGEKFTVLIIPKTNALEDATIDKLLEAAEKGVRIVMQQTDGILANKATLQSKTNSALSTLTGYSNFYYCQTPDAVVNTVNTLGVKSVNLSIANSKIIATKHKYKNNSVFMFVNTSDKNASLTITINEQGETYKLWDIYDGSVKYINAEWNKDDTSTINISVPAERCVFVTVE